MAGGRELRSHLPAAAPRGEILPRRVLLALVWLSSTSGRLRFSCSTVSRNGAARRDSPATTATRRVCHRGDRSSAGTRRSNHQDVSLRSDRRQGTRGQGALPGSVSRLRGAHRATQRQGRRLCILQTLPSRRDCAAMDTGTGSRGDARVASALRRCAVLLRLVAHARRRGGEALTRLQAGEWPAPSTVIDLYGAWAAARADAFGGA